MKELNNLSALKVVQSSPPILLHGSDGGTNEITSSLITEDANKIRGLGL